MRFRSIAIVLAALFETFVSVSLAQSQPPTPSETTEPQQAQPGKNDSAAQPDQRKADPPPIIVNILPTPKSDHDAEEERKERKEKAELDRKLVELTSDLALFTAGLFAATAALVLATAALAYYAFRQSRDMKESVSQSKRAADIAEASLTKLQRAFVTFQGMRYLSHTNLDDGKVWWSTHFNWLNSGASPATKVRIFVSRYFEDSDMPADFKFEVPTDRPTNFMGPNSSLHTAGFSFTADDLIAVRENRKFLYFWGRVDYRDIFDGSPDHVTKFSMRAKDFRGDPAKEWDDKTNIVEIIFDNSPSRHNCADEDCNQ